MDSQVNILIADDHQIFIDGLKSLLRKEKRFNIVDEKLDGRSAYARIQLGGIDLLITDLSMPGLSGVELVKLVKSEYPNVKVLVLSMHCDTEVVTEILFNEAEGYILKNTGKSEFIAALNKISGDGTYYSSEVLQKMMERVRKQKAIKEEIIKLTERELEIIKLICNEYTSQEIADKLFISRRTVDTHRQNIIEKTQVKTIVGLIKYAIRNNLACIDN
ncbi:response regulator [Bacteroidota bacterium]